MDAACLSRFFYYPWYSVGILYTIYCGLALVGLFLSGYLTYVSHACLKINARFPHTYAIHIKIIEYYFVGFVYTFDLCMVYNCCHCFCIVAVSII